MFRWYRDATKCYVYLSDVSTGKHSRSSELLWEPAFRQSRWFTRGWTLQELLAPRTVEFFSRDGKRLGNKSSLEQQIHEVTGIAIQALQGGVLSEFSVDERRSWAAKRQTTIEEDQTYCLLGIFDVYLPLIYGEGKEHAFRRLQDEIDRRSGDTQGGSLDFSPYRTAFALHGVPVSDNFVDRPSDTAELEQCLLPQSRSRLDHRRRIFVLYGLGGIGKTQLAADFARRHQATFSSVFWLDGRSEDQLRQSLAGYASRIPEGQIPDRSIDRAQTSA